MFTEITEDEIIYQSYGIDFIAVVRWFYDFFAGSEGNFDAWLETAAMWWYLFSILSFMVSVILLVGIVYSTIRASQLSEIEDKQLAEAERTFRHAQGTISENTKWQQILAHASSDSPSEWRLAIIEADIMLGEMLDGLGYVGSSIGEQLKQARPETFRTVQDAWDAHKVRNEIAHRGSDFVLTKKIAQATITQYERVFREFKFL